VRRWVAGESPVLDYVWMVLKRLCGERRAILTGLINRL
jgi:hypothetical protein